MATGLIPSSVAETPHDRACGRRELRHEVVERLPGQTRPAAVEGRQRNVESYMIFTDPMTGFPKRRRTQKRRRVSQDV
jgi:hypothetical protein